ncbi:MAG: heavy-metal-associated domain-containing protein [Burkholderiales bacterium]|nr:heavy-metal-associated domain-containing protein [Burkholderiales bacterium]
MYELQVEGMSCNHCVSKVTRSIKKIDADANVNIQLASQKVSVESTADVEDIASALAEAGYPVKDKFVS